MGAPFTPDQVEHYIGRAAPLGDRETCYHCAAYVVLHDSGQGIEHDYWVHEPSGKTLCELGSRTRATPASEHPEREEDW
jgi:hypothetical protein